VKRWLLGPVYSRLQQVLEEKGSIDPRQALTLVHSALSRDRPRLRERIAALGFLLRVRQYRGRRALSISTHYDHPAAFYRLFLDTDYNAYSGAVFDDDSWTLERAQRRKFEILTAKLAAKPGHNVVEIGCGWGSFLKYAREAGLEVTGLTLSREQAEECRRLGLRAEYADAADRIPEPVDRLIAIGMMEHCKDRRADILRNCFSALVPGGRMVVQEMCVASEPGHAAAAVFVAEEFFPGDRLGTYNSVQHEARRAGFQVAHLECFGRHYVATTLEWARRLADRFEEAEALVGYRAAMTHLLSQAGFAWYFKTGALDLIQYVLVKPG
jgi:cyclopropane-fatty-acyl-phospholipid synthase